MRTFNATPRASMLIESMRDIGYSLETALADIIDNSITARATTIQIFADIRNSESKIGILDDGEGMTETDLLDAMRPGSRNPRDERDRTDLGRFGLGLKTASFSQCRRLSVVTRRAGVTSAAVWDLDFVEQHDDDWLVQIPDNPASIPWADKLCESGTLVVWENLDRLIDRDGSEKGLAHAIRCIDDTREHLELVFHRFLSGARGAKKIFVLLNNRPLVPFDPFNSNNPATIADPIERIKVGDQEVVVRCFTLPHHSKVSPAEWDRYAGREGYLKSQGFYVYRGNRLIIHGTWFGLARQMELTKLARVLIDIPNDLDTEWKIDVRKASAQPPRQVRDRLQKIIEVIGATSKRVYKGRGRILAADSRLPVWNRIQNKNEITYQLNLDHPVFADFMSRLPDELGRIFLRVIELAGSTLPMDALFADWGGAPEKVTENTPSDETLLHTVLTTAKCLRDAGVSQEIISDMLRLAEPFQSNWSRTEEMLSQTVWEDLSDE